LNPSDKKTNQPSRRSFLKSSAAVAAVGTLASCSSSARETFMQKHFKDLTVEDKKRVFARLEGEYSARWGGKFSVDGEPAREGVEFAYALDLSRCVGCRRCVYACVTENNQSRDPAIHWISVLQMDKEKGVDLHHSTKYYSPKKVPEEGHFYMPVSCQQCRRPQCVTVCPVEATWQEPDGVVVVDYNWCIGCRYCMAACPYGARHVNWGKPTIPEGEVNRSTHYLGNRPRMKGVVEKCTFCLQRSRKGLYPSCVEACPVGARKFGNLLDKESEIRYIIENKRIYLFKEEINTQPRFYYFYGV
jgi:Fe-S-cluster-containing dehydrogenase component